MMISMENKIKKAKPGDIIRCVFCESSLGEEEKKCFFLVIGKADDEPRKEFEYFRWKLLALTSGSLSCLTVSKGKGIKTNRIEDNSNFIYFSGDSAGKKQ
jgi:hypothetical protein